ncbi:MAG TPA: sulfotransferase [Stellaceae bacterium]|nr:sulfotransferase [Stellaceae bacterium]
MTETTQRAAPAVSHQAKATIGRDPRLDEAVRLHGTGDVAGAEAACRTVLQQEPRNATALLMLAEFALGRADAEAARKLIDEALRYEPDLALGHFALGRANHLQGRLVLARDAYGRAAALMPRLAVAHSNLGLVLFDLKDYAGALASAQRALALQPNDARTHLLAGNAMAELGQKRAAIPVLRRAIELDPRLAAAHNRLGWLLQAGEDFEGAVACFRRAIVVQPDLALAHFRLGRALDSLGRSEEAIAAFRQAIALQPNLDAPWNGLGALYRGIGRFDEAAACFRRALELNPTSSIALRNLSVCEVGSGAEAEAAAMAALADDPQAGRPERIKGSFAVAKWLDDAGRYDEAFTRYVQANALCREEERDADARFDVAELRREVDLLAETFTHDFFAARRGWGVRSEVPVFIVGLFRSGTTLVEQIAASHKLVFGAGELSESRAMAKALMASPPAALDWAEADLRGIAARHLAYLRSKAPTAARIIDKHPENVFSLGLVACLFPEARIVFCHRDPRDAALSCFMQQFAKGQPFSSDLADCAHRWIETERAARLWRELLPLRMLDIQYETLVGDLEGQSRRLIEFLGLDWDPACLDFHETERSVRTFSAWQVRQPIYTSSVGRWKNYERHLGPMLDVFREAGVALD